MRRMALAVRSDRRWGWRTEVRTGWRIGPFTARANDGDPESRWRPGRTRMGWGGRVVDRIRSESSVKLEPGERERAHRGGLGKRIRGGDDSTRGGQCLVSSRQTKSARTTAYVDFEGSGPASSHRGPIHPRRACFASGPRWSQSLSGALRGHLGGRPEGGREGGARGLRGGLSRSIRWGGSPEVPGRWVRGRWVRGRWARTGGPQQVGARRRRSWPRLFGRPERSAGRAPEGTSRAGWALAPGSTSRRTRRS